MLQRLVILICFVALTASALAQSQAPGFRSLAIGGAGYVPCSDNKGNAMPPPHAQVPIFTPPFTWSPPIFRSAAAVRGSTITATYTIHSSNGYTGSLSVDNASCGSVPISFSPSMVALNIPPGGTQTFSLTLGALPNFVMRGPLTVNWRYSSNGQQDGVGGYSLYGFYVVYAAPCAPQASPWVGVLEDACVWAEGESTATGVAESCTDFLYFGYWFSGSDVFTYISQSVYTSAPSGVRPRSVFDLKKFLADASIRPVEGNCHDVSSYLSICMNALGLDSKVLYAQLPNASSFRTNPLYAIGHSDETTPSWFNHQMALFRTLGPTYDTIYDACPMLKAVDWPAAGREIVGYWQQTEEPLRSLVSIPQNSTSINYVGSVTIKP